MKGAFGKFLLSLAALLCVLSLLEVAARGGLSVDPDRDMTGHEDDFIDHVHCDGSGRIDKAESIVAAVSSR